MGQYSKQKCAEAISLPGIKSQIISVVNINTNER